MSKVKISAGSLLVIFVIVLIAGPYVWRYTFEPILARRAAWEGTIVKKREKTRGKYASHWAYLWHVECTDGKTRTVRVTRGLYIMSRPNQEVRKLRGERWPRIKELEGRRHPDPEVWDKIKDKLPPEVFPEKAPP